MQLEKAAARAIVVLTVNETNSILTQFKHEATCFPCLKRCCDLKLDASGPTSFLEYRPLVLIWLLQIPMNATLIFDKILQSLNWQRQDSLTRSPVARTLSWELVPSRPVGPEWDLAQIGTPQRRQIGTQKSVLSGSNRNTVQNPRNASSANHRTSDGCDAMATLLFSCKLQRSLLSVTSPAKRPTPDKPLAMEAYKG